MPVIFNKFQQKFIITEDFEGEGDIKGKKWNIPPCGSGFFNQNPRHRTTSLKNRKNSAQILYSFILYSLFLKKKNNVIIK